MRALCGAIITAGALIGLGLTAIGIGQRYAMEKPSRRTASRSPSACRRWTGRCVFILVFLTCVAVIGLGISFLGLAYHHHRREREHLLHRDRVGHLRRTATP